MAYCYQCGCDIPPGQGVRREVETGTGVHRRSDRLFSSSSTTYYGKRIVCAECAKRIDEREGFKLLLILLAVAAMAAYLIFA